MTRTATKAKPRQAATTTTTPLPGTAAPAGLAIRRVKVADLHNDPGNVRLHDDRNLGGIAASLKEFGQVEPLVVQKGTGKVIGGNGRLTVLKSQGIDECDVVELDIDHVRAAALSITLNRSAETATWDLAGLGQVVGGLKDQGFDLSCLGFTGVELEALVVGPGHASDPAEPPEKGTGLAKLAEVALDEPKTQVAPGQVFKLGRHTLICCDVLHDWPQWVAYLVDGTLFMPYPSPLLPLADSDKAFVLVQPDAYLCGLTVDFYEAVHAA